MEIESGGEENGNSIKDEVNITIGDDSCTEVDESREDDTELNEVLAEVEKIMDTNIYDDIVWQGDLSWDMSRGSGFSLAIKRFLTRLGLVSLWENTQ